MLLRLQQWERWKEGKEEKATKGLDLYGFKKGYGVNNQDFDALVVFCLDGKQNTTTFYTPSGRVERGIGVDNYYGN